MSSLSNHITPQRNFHKANKDNIKDDLADINWKLITDMSVNESCGFLVKSVSEIMDKHVPLKWQSNRRKKKWIDTKCIASIKKKFSAWKQYIKYKTHSNYRKHCAARNACTRTTRNARRNFERNITENI